MPLKLHDTETSVKLKEALPVLRSGGENIPFEYPHLYRIQAGDWRISYAVEHNRLAILVLEVLNSDGSVRKDEKTQTVERKMKVKLLDWPEGSPSRDLPPEEVGKKLKIKFLDMADELKPESPAPPRSSLGIKLAPLPAPLPAARSGKGRITFVDAAARPPKSDEADPQSSESRTSAAGKVTPLDGPTL